MHYEVEQKFRCDDLDAVRGKLLTLGAERGEVVEQADCYYKHPLRDFAQTDEAFRLRRVGERNYFTYKGPKIDATTKSRREEEVRLADGNGAHETADRLVRALGFQPVAVVEKRRETLDLTHGGAEIEAALDEVRGVGSFVELEASVEGEDAAATDAAKRSLAEVASLLGLHDSERRSYLELMLAGASKS